MSGAGVATAVPREGAGGRLALSIDPAEAEWDAYVAAHPEATSDHWWAWRLVIERTFGHGAVYLAVRRAGAMAGVLPLVLVRSRLFGRAALSMPFLNYGGVLADDAEAAGALLEEAARIARAFGAAHVELRHTRRQFPALPSRSHKLALTRPLPDTADALWGAIDRKVRNQVRKAQKSGLSAAQGGAELTGAFFQVFAENMRDLGTPVYPRELFEETLRQWPDRVRVTVIRHGADPVAAAMTVAWRGTVLVPWASALRRYRALCPNMLLYWTLLERAVADGARTFDFGRSSPGSGPHHFKLQWGAHERPLAWEYVLVAAGAPPEHGPSNPRFRLAIEAWKRLPLGVANRLGPWVAAHLP